MENPALASFKSISGSMYGYRFAYSLEAEVLAKMKAGGARREAACYHHTHHATCFHHTHHATCSLQPELVATARQAKSDALFLYR